LIWDSYTYKTDVATLKLLTLSVSYQPSLPLITDMMTGVFVSASLYYTASYYAYFYKDYANYVSLNAGWCQGIVYTSDVSKSTCYTMQASSSLAANLATDIIT
jgi:hypothetical protein